jgi:hypothetical protein
MEVAARCSSSAPPLRALYTELAWQSQGDCIFQPRVARHELPLGLAIQISPTLQGLDRWRDVPFNPFRVGIFFACRPRVARASQPWAIVIESLWDSRYVCSECALSRNAYKEQAIL